jgi:hypothetical protein
VLVGQLYTKTKTQKLKQNQKKQTKKQPQNKKPKIKKIAASSHIILFKK